VLVQQIQKYQNGELVSNRLIAFGCSFTFGVGLPDCFKHQGAEKIPSKLGWVQILADKMNLTAHNMSKPGSSNLEILDNILKFKFEESDIVVVMWTMPTRELYLRRFPVKKDLQMGPWNTDSISKRWIESLDDHDQGVKSWINAHHADLVLKQNNVKYLHIPCFPKAWDPHKPDYINIDNMDMTGLIKVDEGLDPHPGIESNKLTADKIFNLLN
jgi:hypothetical protein